MGFMDSMATGLSGLGQIVLPIGGAVAGGILGGPNGAVAGGMAGSAASQAINNMMNYNFMEDNLAYQKALQRDIFRREDTAAQRRAQDLIRAGLSPTLAAGSAASAGAVINTTAPHRDNVDAGNITQAVMGMIKMQQDISMTEAQTKLIKQQTNVAGAEALLKLHDAAYYKNKAIPTNATGIEKMISSVIGLVTDRSPKEIARKMVGKAADAVTGADKIKNKSMDELLNPTKEQLKNNPYIKKK